MLADCAYDNVLYLLREAALRLRVCGNGSTVNRGRQSGSRGGSRSEMTGEKSDGGKPLVAVVGRTWADLIAAAPIWLIGVAALAFVFLMLFSIVLAQHPYSLGFLGTFGPYEPTVAKALEFPSGAVVAFDRTEGCPSKDEGWEPFEPAISRVILGAVGPSRSAEVPVGVTDENGNRLTAHQFRRDGGEEAHVLTIPEIPEHTHGGVFQSSGFSFEHHQSNDRLPGQQWDWGRETKSAGGGAPHNNLPPYIALYYCKKQ